MFATYGACRKYMESIFSNRSLKVEEDEHFLDSLYRYPPKEIIQLSDLEQLAIDRSEFLHKVESLSTQFKKYSDQYESELYNLIQSYTKSIKTKFGSNENKFDNIAHFLLRLAFTKSLTQRRWFINQETEIFRIKIKNFVQIKILKLVKAVGVEYEEKSIFDDLQDKNNEYFNKDYNNNKYKLKFENALDFVKSRKAPILKGWVYINSEQLSKIVVDVFKSNLQHECAKMVKNIRIIEEDDRLMLKFQKILDHNEEAIHKFTPQSNDKISINNIDTIANISFPPCMQCLHTHLNTQNHLKHQGRIQYGLFLKGIGLSLEESLTFWRSKFSKNTTPEKFDKLYSYYIRYNYGLEGKRTDFAPQSCLKIILNNPNGAGEVHGCTFKHYDQKHLENYLKTHKISSNHISQIVELSKEQHYQVACSRFFEIVHHQSQNTISISHPNDYFQQSRKILSAKK